MFVTVYFPSAQRGKCAAWAWTTAALVRIRVRSAGGEEMRAGRRGASGGKKRQKERGRENSKDESFMAMCQGTKKYPPFYSKRKVGIFIMAKKCLQAISCQRFMIPALKLLIESGEISRFYRVTRRPNAISCSAVPALWWMFYVQGLRVGGVAV